MSEPAKIETSEVKGQLQSLRVDMDNFEKLLLQLQAKLADASILSVNQKDDYTITVTTDSTCGHTQAIVTIREQMAQANVFVTRLIENYRA